MEQPAPLQHAIAQLEAQRPALGDAAVDAAIAALRQHAVPNATEPAAPLAQRLRQISILFADVADSTAMLGRVGPQDAMDLLGRALQSFADAVNRWGGQVLRFTGDGVKAAFGMQGLREDEAERAVRAGLQILADAQRHARAVQQELGISGFGVRVGIHTGPVLMGGGVEAEHSAMGHAVNLAARMEQSAPVARLRVSDDTWSQVRGLFRAEAQPPLWVKGHDEPLKTWLVTAAESGPELQVLRGIEGLATPMIGRDAELQTLLALQARSVSEGRLMAALVIGDAGMGKTRLRQELLRHLGLHEGHNGLLQARAHPSNQQEPYGLLRQLLTRWLDLRDDMPLEAVRQRLLQGLAPWLGTQAHAKAARIGQLLGLDFSADPAVQAIGPAMLREQAFAALRSALLERARAAPLLLVLDDLHWADGASLDFVQELLVPAERPLTVLLLARPSLHEPARPPEGRIPQCAARRLLDERGVKLAHSESAPLTELVLSALGDGDSRNLIQALLQSLPDAPAALSDLLRERAAGNPFFAEALVRMLIDDGAIDASESPWRLSPDKLASLRVPPTLVGVLQARLDALPSDELMALQNASIVGTVFWDAALAALDPLSPLALHALQRRSLIHSHSSSAFGDTSERAFGHQLLHDTTYDTVLKPQRRDGHARAARWLSGRVQDRAGEFLGITADHFERAGDSAQALEYYWQAFEDAMDRYARDSALYFVERALAQAALTHPGSRYKLLSERQAALDRLGDEAGSVRAIDDMAAWAEKCNDDAMRADAAVARMLRADHEGRPADAQSLAEQALRWAGQASPTSAAMAHGELAWLALLREDFADAEQHIANGLVHADAAAKIPRRAGGDEGMALKLHAIRIEALILQERYAQALAAIEEGMGAAERVKRARAQALFNFVHRQAIAQRHLGQLEASLQSSQRSVAVARDTGMGRLVVAALGILVETALMLQRHEVARTVIEEESTLAATVDNGYGAPTVLEHRGQLAMDDGDLESAARHWRASLEQYQAQGRGHQVLQIRCELAAIDIAQGRHAAAREAVDALLADVAKDPRPQRRALQPAGLLAAQQVLQALGDPRAEDLKADLVARLRQQLRSLPDEAARATLLQGVPAWGVVHRMMDSA